MRRTMYHNSAVRIVYRSYAPEAAMSFRPTYSRWEIAFWELAAMFVTGFVVAVLL